MQAENSLPLHFSNGASVNQLLLISIENRFLSIGIGNRYQSSIVILYRFNWVRSLQYAVPSPYFILIASISSIFTCQSKTMNMTKALWTKHSLGIVLHVGWNFFSSSPKLLLITTTLCMSPRVLTGIIRFLRGMLDDFESNISCKPILL